MAEVSFVQKLHKFWLKLYIYLKIKTKNHAEYKKCAAISLKRVLTQMINVLNLFSALKNYQIEYFRIHTLFKR